jgi:hypothetical protein
MGWGKSGRRTPTGPAYDFHTFLTTDARQNALDDYQLAPIRMSGAGLVPLFMPLAAEPCRDWVYSTQMIGLGGNFYTGVMPTQPLINNSAFTMSFLIDQETTQSNP